MKIPCSNCNQRLEIPEELAGQTIECPACNASLTVPTLAAPPSAPAQVQKPAPQAATSKKSKSPIAKWAIAAVFGIVLVILVMVFSGGSNDVSTLEPTTAKAERKQQQELPAGTSQPQPPDKPFYDRAMMGDIEAVKQHLAAGTGVNTQNKNGRTALHWATVNGHKDIVELLINEGADVNLKDLAGETPLDWIGALSLEEAYLPEAKGEKIKSVKDEIANLLRKHGAKTGKEPSIPVPIIGSNPAVWAEAVKQAIADGADVKSQNDEAFGSENAPLIYAVGFGLTEIVELLIANGANVNAQEKRGFTPLDFAKGKTAALLRKHGGKMRKQLKAQNNEHGLGNYQNKRGYGYKLPKREPIHDAADNGDIEGVKRHLSAGVDVNTKTKDRYTPLHFASMGGFKEIVELLIAEGAAVNAKEGYFGRTPMELAIEVGKRDTADLLRKHGGKTGRELKAEGK